MATSPKQFINGNELKFLEIYGMLNPNIPYINVVMATNWRNCNVISSSNFEFYESILFI